MMSHEQVTMLEQIADLLLDPLLTAGGTPGRLRGGTTLRSLGAVAASPLRSWATEPSTALVTSLSTWKVQS